MAGKVDWFEDQKASLEVMVKLYCKKNHNSKGQLCEECEEILNYALNRLRNCRYGENKPNCGDCKTCCYKKDMKEKVVNIMRYSGPRLLLHNPRIVFSHFINKFKCK